MRFICAYCGAENDKPSGEVNRARNARRPLYCGRKCMGLARRKHKSAAQKKEEKRLYDVAYRQRNLASIKAKKAAHYQLTRDPEKERAYRKANMARHVEYCRRPEYRSWKREYDRQYRAREFGGFADAYLLALDLNREIKGKMTNAEIDSLNGTQAKRQARAREEGSPGHRDRPRDRTTQRKFA